MYTMTEKSVRQIEMPEFADSMKNLSEHPDKDAEITLHWNTMQEVSHWNDVERKYRREVPKKYWDISTEPTALSEHLPSTLIAPEIKAYMRMLQQYLGAIEGRVKRGMHTNIVLLGESGIGKSYLMAWTMKSLMNTIKYYENPLNESPTPKDFPHYWNVEYTTGQTLGRRYKACDSYRSTETKRDVCNVYAYCDLFMLDEGGRVSTTYEKEALFDIMDEREKSCIISANFKSLDEMQDYYGDACMDRIRQNMVVPNTEGCASMRGSTELSQDRDLTEMQDFGDGVSEQFTDDVPF